MIGMSAITAPEDGFTTRFELRRRTEEGTDLESDLLRFLPDDDALGITRDPGNVRSGAP